MNRLSFVKVGPENGEGRTIHTHQVQKKCAAITGYTTLVDLIRERRSDKESAITQMITPGGY